MKVCETKKRFDTEFEATVAAARVTGFSGHSMEAYRCGNHWHVTHSDRRLRRGFGGGDKFWRCPSCKRIETKSRAPKHQCDTVVA